jgi:ribosomal protein S18 acetylase RimI-like enzyme
MLLDAVIAWARARNASSLNLGVTCGDSPARRLYERAGFKPTGEPQPLRPGSKLSAQSMRLALRVPPNKAIEVTAQRAAAHNQRWTC